MKKLAVAFALILASFALVACGSSDDSTSSETTATETQSESTSGGEGGSKKAEGKTAGGGSTLDISSPSSGLAFTSDTATAKAGKVTLSYTNPQPLAHDVAIEDSSGKEVGATELIASGSDTTTVDLKPGTYTYFCTVPGHREAGMEGTLTVK
jgi:plastocyanin